MTRLATRFQRAEDSPGFMLWKAANRLQRLHAEVLSDLEVTPTQCSLLTCLVYLQQGEGGAVTASRIVEHSGMDKMSVSDLLKSLERKKLLRRRPHPEDGRSRLVEVTAAGERITNAAVTRIEALDTEFFAGVKSATAFHADLVALAGW